MRDALFQQAVSAIDAGDALALERLLAAHPRLARDRLDSPGPWLRDTVGDALDGFFYALRLICWSWNPPEQEREGNEMANADSCVTIQRQPLPCKPTLPAVPALGARGFLL